MHPLTEDIAERATEHSEAKHLAEFSDARWGTQLAVTDSISLKEHTAFVLESKETHCFTAFVTEQPERRADIFYHRPSNTIVIAPFDHRHAPTVYRPDDGEELYKRKLNEATKVEINRTIVEKQGIHDLHPVPERQQTQAPEHHLTSDGAEPVLEPPQQQTAPERPVQPVKRVFRRDRDDGWSR